MQPHPDMPRPHDLLWLAPAASLTLDGDSPSWLTPDWLQRAPLVVRREHTPHGRIPVGMRGLARSQRCKGYLDLNSVQRRISPEMLVAPGMLRGQDGIPALAALSALAPAIVATGLAWGPTGGVGFFLACGLPVLRADSDLDLLVRAPQPLTSAQAATLAVLQEYTACRIDIQVDSGSGAFALAEWQRSAGRVLLKTGAGPVMTDNPWRNAA